MNAAAPPIAQAAPGRRIAWVPVVACTVVAALFRVWVLSDLRGEDPALQVPLLDDAAYLRMAERMVSGTQADWFLAPLHPWLVAQASRLFPLDLLLACGVNVALGSLTAGAAAWAAVALHSRAAGWVAGLAYAMAGAFVFQDVIPGQEPVLALLHLAGLVLALRLTHEGGWRAALTFGLVVGVAMMARGTSVALLAAGVLAIRIRPTGRRLAVATAMLVGVTAVLATAHVRNIRMAGHVNPLPWAGGVNLYMANSPDARDARGFLSTELGEDPETIRREASRIARAALGEESTSPDQWDGWWRRRAWEERGSAGEFAGHLGRKTLLFWSAGQRGSNHAITAEREFASWLGIAPTGVWWMLVGGAMGWWLMRRTDRRADVLAAVVAAHWLLLVVFFPIDRYRAVAAAVSLVPLAAAVVDVVRARPSPRAAMAPLGLGTALTVVALLPVAPVDLAQPWANLANASAHAGQPREVSERLARRALGEDEANGPAHMLLAAHRQSGGDLSAALEHLTVAAADRRTRFPAQVAAIPILVDLGRIDQAMYVARGLLSEVPGDARLLAFAAYAADRAGDRMIAGELLRNALRIAPDDADVQWVLARVR